MGESLRKKNDGLENGENFYLSQVDNGNNTVEELSSGLENNGLGCGSNEVEGRDKNFINVGLRNDSGTVCKNSEVTLRNEMFLLRLLVDKISAIVSNGCSKVELSDVKSELAMMRREVVELRTYVNRLFGIFSSTYNLRNFLSPNSATIDGAPSPVNLSENISCPSGVKSRGYITPEKSYDLVSGAGDSNKKREGKYSSKRKVVEMRTGSFGKSKIAKLLFDTKIENRSASTSANVGVRSVATFRCGPFALERPLLDADVSLLEYIFSSNLNSTEIVVEMEFNELRRADMLTLSPKRWLDGEVIATVCEMLMKESAVNTDGGSLNAYIPPRYSDIVLGGSPDWIGFVHQHHLKERYMINLLMCNKLFFPILDGIGKHWILMIVDVRNRKAELWDSYHSEARAMDRLRMCSLVLQSLDILMEKEIQVDLSKEYPFFGNFDVSQRIGVPEQDNTFDCGMYIVAFMQNWIAALSHDFEVRGFVKIEGLWREE